MFNAARREATGRSILQGAGLKLRIADRQVIADRAKRSAGLEEAIRRRIQALGPESNPDTRVYDVQIADTQRRLDAEHRHLDRLRLSAIPAYERNFGRLLGDETAEPHPWMETLPESERDRLIAMQEQTIQPLEEDLAHYNRLKAHAGRRQARRGSERQRKAGARAVAEAETSRVKAHGVKQFRGGETIAQHTERVKAQKDFYKTRLSVGLARHARNTEMVRDLHQARITRESLDAVNAAFAASQYGRKVHLGGLRGALVGGGIGLTAAGLAMLAGHIATAHTRAGERAKDTDTLMLGKAESDPDQGSPEHQIGRGLAETFRQWIDRLLGKAPAQGELNLADDLIRAIGPGLTQGFAEGAQHPPIEQPEDPRYVIETDFDQLNPAVRRHMASYALDRIVEISEQQREAIRTAIMNQAVLQGIGPKEVARTIKESIGLTTYQMGQVSNFRTELENLDPAAFDRKLRDGRFDATLRRAIETGTPLTADQIAAMVDAYHRRFVAYRARVIARTEALRAVSFGGVAQAQSVLDAHPELDVIKHWLSTADERTRPTHVDLDGKEVTGMQTPFRTSAGNLIKWPLDVDAAAEEVIQCRCTLQFLFKPKRQALFAMAA